MALPNFLCIGAEKAGTSPLALMLMQHPDIYIPAQKETAYFSQIRRYDDNLVLYEATEFKDYRGQAISGELTPDYMRVPGLAHDVRESLGTIKVIVCLREPLARAFSHYHQRLRLMGEDRPFAAACEQDAALPLWPNEYRHIRTAYVRGSWYPYQLVHWIHEFGRENFFFCILERDMINDFAKREMMARLFDFLGVPRFEINPAVRNTSLPAPKVLIFSKPGIFYDQRQHKQWPVKTGDILFLTGVPNMNRLIVHPSSITRAFFERMERNMTVMLDTEEATALRRTYFREIVGQTSELIAEDLTGLWM
jgi:hypothetical protein